MSMKNRIISVLVSLAMFVCILLGINSYQYFRIKEEIASNIITTINDNELKNLQVFFQGIVKPLNIVRDWGKSGVIDKNNLKELNKQLIPFVENQPSFSGVLLADNHGSEYYLASQQGGGFLTRRAVPDGNEVSLEYQLWEDVDTPGRKWTESSDYNPVERPWFNTDVALDTIHWTSPYTFYQTKEEGFTVSVAWASPEDESEYTVFAIDILLKSIEKLLSEAAKDSPVDIFLVNRRDATFLTGSGGGALSKDTGSKSLSAVQKACIDQWNRADKPERELITVTYEGEKWVASLQPVSDASQTIWIGVTAPEKALMESLNKKFYAIDVVDILVALLTSVALFFLLWKIGLFRSAETLNVAPIVRLTNYINAGEGPGVEFKSSVRMNLNTGKVGKEIELAWIKAVVAFLNTTGGALLIGVNDEGRIVGLAADNFENNDRCLLHLKNLIHQHIGAEFAGCIQTTLVESENAEVVLLECQAAPDPVFCKVGKNEEFYIRSGPSSTKLTPSQMISYVLQNRG